MKNRTKMIWMALVGEIGQGKCSKAWIEPTNWITHRMRGLGTWLQGGASCLYWKASMIHTSMRLELLVCPWLSKPSPAVFPSLPTPSQGFSRRLKGSRRQRFPAQPPQKCQVEQRIKLTASRTRSSSPKRPSLQINARGGGGGGWVGAYSRWLGFGKINDKWLRGNPCWPRWGME